MQPENLNSGSSNGLTAHWYAIHTKPREEERAILFLARKDVLTFLPRLLVNRRHGSHRWQAVEPLFPGYLFARFAPEPYIVEAVRWTPGVKQLLWDGTEPVPVPDDVVEYLQWRSAESGLIVPGPRLKYGMRVRITSGPLEHLEGIIERPPSSRQRVRVLLELLNTHVPVEADAEDLEVV